MSTKATWLSGSSPASRWSRTSTLLSFQLGKTSSNHFRRRANRGPLGGRDLLLALSAAVTGPAGRAVKAQQSGVTAATVATLASQNILAVPQPWWGGPWTGMFDPNPGTALLQIHGTIPQTMMHAAARRAG